MLGKPDEAPRIEQIVERIKAGETGSAEELLPLVYEELRSLASQRLAKETTGSLDTSDLVNETYLRLVGPKQNWDGKSHFFGAAAEAMRRVLVDRARRRQRVKHGGDMRRMPLHESGLVGPASPLEILVVNDLFDQFSESHPKEAEVAKLRYFGGLSLAEVASALDISIGTVHNYWKFARAWLYREVQK